MMENLGVRYSELVKVRSATLPKGQYVKLRPQSKTFLDIANPKVKLLCDCVTMSQLLGKG